jgi:hypothetical protein
MRAGGLFALAILCVGAGCGRSGSVPEGAPSRPERILAEASLGPVKAVVRTDAEAPRFGDRFRVVLEVTHEPRAEVAPITFPARLGHLLRRGREDPPRGQSGVQTYVLVVEPERTGTNVGKFPDLAFEVTSGEGAGQSYSLEIAAFEMDVEGLPEGERPSLADVGEPLPPLPLPPKERDSLTLWLTVAGVAVVVALGVLAWFVRRPRERALPPLDPAAEARRALEALLARKLVEQGAFGEFYVGLTGIVRTFIERTTGVDAPDQTTEEFLRDIEHHEKFPVERRRALARFLEAADLVKYAGQVPGRSEVDDAVDAAIRFCGLDMKPAPLGLAGAVS